MAGSILGIVLIAFKFLVQYLAVSDSEKADLLKAVDVFQDKMRNRSAQAATDEASADAKLDSRIAQEKADRANGKIP